VIAVGAVDSSQHSQDPSLPPNQGSPPKRQLKKPTQDELPDTIVQLLGYFIKRLFDLISEVSGDTKRAVHAGIMLAAVSLPIGAVFFYLHLDPKRWHWVLISSGGTILSATAIRIVKVSIRSIKARHAAKASKLLLAAVP
jgi:hypothetical protein